MIERAEEISPASMGLTVAEGKRCLQTRGASCDSRLTIRIKHMVLVQIFKSGAARSGEEYRLCGEYRIPDCRGILVFEMETSQGELSFANTTEQFDAGHGASCAIKVLKAEHRTCSGFNAPVILLDQIVQVFRRSQLGVLPCLVLATTLVLASCCVEMSSRSFSRI